jgi:hypothetical protein
MHGDRIEPEEYAALRESQQIVPDFERSANVLGRGGWRREIYWGNESDSRKIVSHRSVYFAANENNTGPACFALDRRGGTRATDRIQCGLQPSQFEMSTVFGAAVIRERASGIPSVFIFE